MSMIRDFLRSGATFSLVLVLVACTSGGDGGNGGGGCPGTGTATLENGEIRLCADNLEFDATTIEAPANEEFNITFTNAESQPHNVAIYREEGGEQIAVGDVITGPDVTNQLAVPALEPGTYYFVCDVHPEMNGTVVVGG